MSEEGFIEILTDMIKSGKFVKEGLEGIPIDNGGKKGLFQWILKYEKWWKLNYLVPNMSLILNISSILEM